VRSLLLCGITCPHAMTGLKSGLVIVSGDGPTQ
jgi:hypothetical protein